MNSQFSYSSIYHDQTSFFTWFPTCHSFYWSSTYHTEHSAFQFLLLSTIHLYHLQMLECFRVFSLSMLYLCSHNQVISFPVSYLKYNLYPDNSHFLLNNSNQMSKKCIKLNMLKSKLLNSLFPPKPVTPVSPISANGNSLIPVVQAKNIEHHLFTLFFFFLSDTPYPILKQILSILPSRYIQNPQLLAIYSATTLVQATIIFFLAWIISQYN